MGKKRLAVVQIIQKLLEAELELARGQTVPQVAKKLGVTEQTYYRWRKEYGGLPTDQAKRFDVARTLSSEDVLERLSDLYIRRGVPGHIRSDNGAELTARKAQEWMQRIDMKTLYIEPGSPWENGYVEPFNGKFRDELLNREIFDKLCEAKVLVERWRREYNTVRPHSSLGYRPPAPKAVQAWSFRYAALREKTKLDSAET